ASVERVAGARVGRVGLVEVAMNVVGLGDGLSVRAGGRRSHRGETNDARDHQGRQCSELADRRCESALVHESPSPSSEGMCRSCEAGLVGAAVLDATYGKNVRPRAKL